MNSNHQLSSDALSSMVGDARQRTLELVQDLSDEQMMGPMLATVNPPRWEIGHVAFFYDLFVLSMLDSSALIGADLHELYNSFLVAHDDRWDLALPDRQGTHGYMSEIHERVLGRLGGAPDPMETYLYELSTLHEDMHDEAIVWTRQTHGYATPDVHAPGADAAAAGRAGNGSHPPATGDAAVPGGEYRLGALEDEPFVFDNEKWAHPVTVAPFRISRTAVSNGQFADFIADGGYRHDEFWGYQGRLWRQRAEAAHPRYWRPGNGGDDAWSVRLFDQWMPLQPNAAVVHLTWFEAQAYCAWAARRLPTEAEWELAASAEPAPDGKGIAPRKRRYPWGDEPPTPERANLDMNHLGTVDVSAHGAGDSAFGCRQMLGNVWEWTDSPFYPYPGFVIDHPYKEYSAPWFGYQKVLRGGSWIVRSRLIRNTYRNFAMPERGDLFAGFRTCALNDS